MARSLLVALALAAMGTAPAAAFLVGPPGIPGVAWGAGTRLHFGFNGLGSEKAEEDSAEKPEKKISAG